MQIIIIKCQTTTPSVNCLVSNYKILCTDTESEQRIFTLRDYPDNIHQN